MEQLKFLATMLSVLSPFTFNQNARIVMAAFTNQDIFCYLFLPTLKHQITEH